MVRMYVRKTTRGCWDERQMVAAMNAMLARKMGYSKASKTFGIPRSTLRRIMKRLEANGEVNIRVPLGTNASVFTKEEEKYLVSHLNSMDCRLFTVTIPIKRKLAYQLATKKHKSHKWKDNVAGREWLREFVKRHKLNCQSIGRPVTKTKLACFNKEAVMKFYEVLGELYLKYNFTADRIYNCDETSISCDTSKSQGNVIAIAGESGNKPSVSGGTTGDSGHTITVEVCMSATGLFMPLLFVFPRKGYEPQFTSNLILPCYAQCNETGWMSSDIFAGWLKHFVKFSRASKENPVLLMMDGDSSHTTSLELLEVAENNGVIMLCLPEYCTHKIGPLEVEFFGNLSKHYISAAKEWTTGHSGQSPGIAEIPLLFEQAFIQSATLATAVVAFRKTGIWPFKPNTFSDHDFTGIGTSLLPHQMASSIQQNNQTPIINNNNNNNNSNHNNNNNNSSSNNNINNNGNNNLPVQTQSQNNPKEPNVSVAPGSLWKPTNNCAATNEMRHGIHPNCVESVSAPQMQPPRKRMYPEHQPVPLQNYQTNNYQDAPLAGPSWKPSPVNPVNEMRLSASSAYVEAVLGGPQNHPARNMEQSEGPGCSNDPAMYSIIPHMFL